MGVKLLRTMTVMCAIGALGAGCSPGETEPPQASAAPEPDPWTLPLEERPPVFNPCEEIDESFLEDGGYSGMSTEPGLENHGAGGFGHSCSWANESVEITIVTSWTPLEEIESNTGQENLGDVQVAGYEGRFFGFPNRPRSKMCSVSTQTETGTVTVGGLRPGAVGVIESDKEGLCAEMAALSELVVQEIEVD